MPIRFDRSRRLQFLLILCIFYLLLPWHPATADGGIQLVEVVGGLSEPVFVTHANDGSGRLFVVEKQGTIRIVQNGQLLPGIFLDIQDRVSNSGEAGFLSVAFPPDYAQSGYFIVYYNHRNRNLVPAPDSGSSNDGDSGSWSTTPKSNSVPNGGFQRGPSSGGSHGNSGAS